MGERGQEIGRRSPLSRAFPTQLGLFERLTSDRLIFRRPVLGCWLVAAFDAAATRHILLERSTVVVDATRGNVVVAPDDLILLWDPNSRKVSCLGPAWAKDGFHPPLSDGALLGVLAPRGHDEPVRLHERRRPAFCLLIEFTRGRADSETFQCMLDPPLSRIARAGAPDFDAPPEALASWQPIDGFAPQLAGAIHQAAASCLLSAGQERSESGLRRAIWHLRLAALSFELGDWEEAAGMAEQLLTRAKDALVVLRQMSLPPPLGRLTVADSGPPATRLGVRVHRLAAVQLPSVSVRSPPEPREHSDPVSNRELLGEFRAEECTLREILAPATEQDLAVSLAIGNRRIGSDQRSSSRAVIGRFCLGRSYHLSVLVDDRLHRDFGVPSLLGRGNVLVVARCSGLEFAPDERTAQVGRPIEFLATPVIEGSHPLRMTFLCGDEVLTRIVRYVEISGAPVGRKSS